MTLWEVDDEFDWDFLDDDSPREILNEHTGNNSGSRASI